MFSVGDESVGRLHQLRFYIGGVFRTRGAVTEKSLSPIRRRVRCTTRSPDDEVRSADRARTSATDVSIRPIGSVMHVCPRSDLWSSKHKWQATESSLRSDVDGC